MEIRETDIPEVRLLVPDVHGDARGFLLEYHNRDRLARAGLDFPVAQINHSRSRRGVLRGLHYQLRHPQAKLVQVINGCILDIAVDIRRGSPSFGRHVSAELSSENHHQLLVPAGFAHGFCVLSETADVLYLCDDVYHPEDEYGIAWNDPGLGIEWPAMDYCISDKDHGWPRLDQADPARLPA
ncbi:MAG TPA: dTDP-4-dehydrorhamnose 3,5-epimerase [Gammaproteobacteria bacterium]|nr:dTDP-4-dehydrorhamnose 3,5-epimerase [Gammaproteobacteria bacterium]